MAKLVGGALRGVSTLFYGLEFCCTAVILGIYSYFLAKLSYHHVYENQDWRAVEGISGAGVLYTIFAVFLTCCLGGIPFFAFLAIVLDILFCAGMVAIAVLTRHGDSCSGYVQTPLGNGPEQDYDTTTHVHLHFACRLNTAAFAVAIIAAFLFAVSALMQIAIARHHQKEKKYGPSPANNYTSGSGNRRFWQRRGRTTRDMEAAPVAAPAGGLAVEKPNDRPSQETGYTGTTMGHADATAGAKYESHNTGYHTGPTGTATVNPYEYQNQPHATATPAINY